MTNFRGGAMPLFTAGVAVASAVAQRAAVASSHDPPLAGGSKNLEAQRRDFSGWGEDSDVASYRPTPKSLRDFDPPARGGLSSAIASQTPARGRWIDLAHQVRNTLPKGMLNHSSHSFSIFEEIAIPKPKDLETRSFQISCSILVVSDL